MTHKHFHIFEARNGVELGRQLGESFGGIVRDYIEEAADCEDWAETRRSSKPLLDASVRHFPNLIGELEAYAEAANVPFLDLWTMMVEDDVRTDGLEMCTTVVTNDGRLVGHNEDWDSDSIEDICIVKKTVNGTTSLELYYYGCPLGGVALSIHANGYVQAINSLESTDWQPGVPKVLIARAIAEIRGNGRELANILSVPRCSGFAHNLVSRDGQVTSLECSAQQHHIANPALPFVHTNHFLSKQLARWEERGDETSSRARYQSGCALVSPNMTIDELSDAMGNRDNGKKSSVLNRNTIARAVVDLENQEARFWLRRERKKGWVTYDIGFLFEWAGV